MDFWQVVQIILAVLGILLVISALYAAAIATRNRGRLDALTTQIDTMATANGELRDQLLFERSERNRQEQQCALQVAELRGAVDTLQGETVTRLIDTIAQAMAKNQREVVTQLATSVSSAVTDAIHLAMNKPDRRTPEDFT